MILEIFPCGPIATNAYLIGCPNTKQAAIIDAPQGCAKPLLQRIKSLDLKPCMILLTHSHWDHLAGLAELKKLVDAPVYVHEADKPNVREPGADQLPLYFAIEGVEPDHLLKEGDVLKVGELTIEVIHTPGHTPGGVCFYLPNQHVLFSGDTLFQGTLGNLSLPTARPALMWSSLKKLAKLPPQTKVYPGHGDSTTIGKEAWLEDAEEFFG